METLSRCGNYSPGLYGLPHMGEVFADYRQKKGYSQETFAIICGVDKKTVVYWEGQDYLTAMDRRIFLCKVLSIPPGYLGLTWRNLVDNEPSATSSYLAASELVVEQLKENAYGLYDDILLLARFGPNPHSPEATYKFLKHQQELEVLVKQAPEAEKDSWKELLCRYYQQSTFIVQHHKDGDGALTYINKASHLAGEIGGANTELVGTVLYRSSRLHLMHKNYGVAKQDIQSAIEATKKAKASLKGSVYLLAADVNSRYATDETQRNQCRKWSDTAANIVHRGNVELDESFLVLDLFAIHHERAKVLGRFALFHASDEELVEKLKDPIIVADKKLLEEAHSALDLAESHMNSLHNNGMMDYFITKARILLIGREFEESARIAKKALQLARKAHSQQRVEEVWEIYTMLSTLAPDSPYILNLGVELGVFS